MPGFQSKVIKNCYDDCYQSNDTQLIEKEIFLKNLQVT